MTAPVETKTLRVSAVTHKAVHDLAARLGGTADDVLRHLMDEATVRIPLTGVQRERWEHSAQAAGMDVAEFVKARVEAAMQFGSDPTTVRLIWDHVRALSQAAGVRILPTGMTEQNRPPHR